MAPDPEVTLKEFMNVRFGILEKKVDGLEAKVEALERRYIGSVVVAVMLALLISGLKQWLGL